MQPFYLNQVRISFSFLPRYGLIVHRGCFIFTQLAIKSFPQTVPFCTVLLIANFNLWQIGFFLRKKNESWHYFIVILSNIFISLTLQNLLGGAIFGIWQAFPLCCVLSAVGASFCFCLSKFFGKVLIMKYFADKLEPFQKMVKKFYFFFHDVINS